MPRHQRGTNKHRYIYLIRHGSYDQSDDHFGGVLNERGIEQTKCLIEPMSKIPVDAIYSSTMHRAFQTAQILRDHAFPDMEIQRTPWLKERIFPGWHSGDDVDEEAESEAREVLDKLWERFFRPSRSERHDVLVCHGNVIRALVTRTLEADLECWIRAGIANCGITQIGCFYNTNPVLISFNERGHLPFALRSVGRGDRR